MTERRSLSLPPPLFAVVPAAGVGARMGAGLPKQYLTLQGRTLAEHTLGRLLAFAPLQAVVVAVADGDPWWPELAVAGHPRVTSVTGGDSRARSVLAGVAAYTSRPEQFRDRDVIHFIDNQGALTGLAKGYSRDVDSARLISVFHTMNAAVRANVWFEYVPSAATGVATTLRDRPPQDQIVSPLFRS